MNPTRVRKEAKVCVYCHRPALEGLIEIDRSAFAAFGVKARNGLERAYGHWACWVEKRPVRQST